MPFRGECWTGRGLGALGRRGREAIACAGEEEPVPQLLTHFWGHFSLYLLYVLQSKIKVKTEHCFRALKVPGLSNIPLILLRFAVYLGQLFHTGNELQCSG